MSQPQPACLPETAGQAHELDVSSFSGPAGYAVLGHEGRLYSSNPQLAVLLGDAVVVSGRLDSLCQNGHGPSAAELMQSLTGTDDSTITLEIADGVTRQLQFGPLRAHRRLLIVSDPHHISVQTSALEQDTLTGLANRHQLNEILSRLESERAAAQSAPTATNGNAGNAAILLIDIDRFKQINDTLGHATGDSLLRLVTGRLRRVTRETDQLMRVGGDEFLLALPCDEEPGGVEQLAIRIVELISRPFLINGQQLNTGVSIGIAWFDDEAEDGATLLQHADLALQKAKVSGRNQACAFQSYMAQEALQRRALEIDIRRALTLQQFRLVYQPQVDLHTGKLAGFEALLRWEHPVRGTVPPIEFIPIAEETGEIRRIGAWVILEACRQASLWPAELTVAVNVSPLQFDDEKLPGHVKDALNRSGIAPERLEIEVTEGLLFHNPDAALAQLTQLRQLGVDIAMDDFGTGYSSLSHLSRFPFTKVKIDQSFVRGGVDDRTQALVTCIISLGASLGMKTLAEGVETPEQYQRLQTSGCDAVQGYLISRPMEAGSTTNFVDQCSRQIHDGDATA